MTIGGIWGEPLWKQQELSCEVEDQVHLVEVQVHLVEAQVHPLEVQLPQLDLDEVQDRSQSMVSAVEQAWRLSWAASPSRDLKYK